MAASQADYRILSPVCDVVWRGWRSNTVELQQAGWQIAVERFAYELRTRLLLSHPAMRIRAITGLLDVQHIERASRREGLSGPRPTFFVTDFSQDFRVVLHESSFNFVEVDTRPQSTIEPMREFDVSSFFATPLVRTEEIIVEPQDVASMLEQIRRMQSPQMAEIRERERRRERDEAGPREIFHAQILSFAN